MLNKLNIMLSISDKDTHCVVSFIKKDFFVSKIWYVVIRTYNRQPTAKRKQKAYNAEGDVVKRTSLRKLYFDDKR